MLNSRFLHGIQRVVGQNITAKARRPSGPRGYAVCTTPRSGSNLLCQYLESTGRLGRPREYFNVGGRRYWDDPAYPDDPKEQVTRILASATANGVYGLKVFAHQHDWLVGKIRWTKALPNLRFVHLSRGDLLGQAISWAKALQTGQYRFGQPETGEARYNPDLIYQQLRALAIENARWEVFFARNALEPLRLTYESVVAEPQRAVDSIAQYLGLGVATRIDVAALTVKLQRDEKNTAWRERFVAERGDTDLLEELETRASAQAD